MLTFPEHDPFLVHDTISTAVAIHAIISAVTIHDIAVNIVNIKAYWAVD